MVYMVVEMYVSVLNQGHAPARINANWKGLSMS